MTGKQISLEFLDHADVLWHDKDGLRTLNNEVKKEHTDIVKETQILEMLFIQYVFLNDDGKISFNEKLKLKSYFHKYRDVLTKEDITFLNDNLKSSTMESNINQYIVTHKITNAVITHTINQLRKKHLNNKKYKVVFDSLERQFKV